MCADSVTNTKLDHENGKKMRKVRKTVQSCEKRQEKKHKKHGNKQQET